MKGKPLPTNVYMVVQGLSEKDAHRCATRATRIAKQLAPRLTGGLAKSLQPYWGPGFFGIKWDAKHNYGNFQEGGIKPFTMRKLANKTIPMWLDDADGRIHKENPGAETRVLSGRHQTLIFRFAAPIGSRKVVQRQRGRKTTQVEVPRSYPGAPGRIAMRHGDPIVPPGSKAGQIMKGNTGVRWRHPGLEGKLFLKDAIQDIARQNGVWGRIYTSSED